MGENGAHKQKSGAQLEIPFLDWELKPCIPCDDVTYDVFIILNSFLEISLEKFYNWKLMFGN